MENRVFEAVLILAVCGMLGVTGMIILRPSPKYEYQCDNVAKREIFLSCLERVPKGPDTVAAARNDWAEVVEECRVTAASIACASVEVK